MIKKVIVISFATIGVITISFILFLSWLSLGGCPTEYWIETEIITETSFPTTNITRDDLPNDLTLRSMLINMVENTSLTNVHKKILFVEWNTTKSLLDASNIIPTESFPSMWQAYVYFENILIHIELVTIAC